MPRRVTLRICAASLVFALSASALPGGVAAQADPDFGIGDGQFFTEALPDRDDGGGFAVQDGHGVKLWTAYKAAGGVDGMGYPISRRFDWDGGVAQAFERGILRWDPVAGSFETLQRDDL